MKLSNSLMALALLLVAAVGMGAKCWSKGDSWNVFVVETPAQEMFAALNEFVTGQEDGKYPPWREVMDFARREIPYVMIYYSHGGEEYQAAFWDGEYSWIYNSADGRVYRMTEDISHTAWYDPGKQQLLGPQEAGALKIEYARL